MKSSPNTCAKQGWFIAIKSHFVVPILLYQLTKSAYLKDFGLYKINSIHEKFATVEIEELASFHPIHLHIVNQPSSENLVLASLRNKPILFPE